MLILNLFGMLFILAIAAALLKFLAKNFVSLVLIVSFTLAYLALYNPVSSVIGKDAMHIVGLVGYIAISVTLRGMFSSGNTAPHYRSDPRADAERQRLRREDEIMRRKAEIDYRQEEARKEAESLANEAWREKMRNW
jgi:hypothetical protein